MAAFAENLNLAVSIGTIVGQVFLVVVIALWLRSRYAKGPSAENSRRRLQPVASHSLFFGFLVAAVSLIVSLIYSEIIGFPPCELCWVQRIFLYPQAVILALALWKKTKDAAIYCLALSLGGAAVAAYHFYGQSFNPSALPACAVAGAPSCAARYFVEFGYVTIPLMSLTAFLLIAVFMLLAMSFERN